MLETFDKSELKKLFVPQETTKNGQVTIIGGSELFHGAPLLSLKVASRIVDMVFFSSPEPSVGRVAEIFKSKLFSFIWVPWNEAEEYIEKSDAVLIGPGFMRFRSEKVPHKKRHSSCDETCRKSRSINKDLLTKFPKKRWVIDAGSLQVMEVDWIPNNAILTPNRKEFEMLFGEIPDGKPATLKALRDAESTESTSDGVRMHSSEVERARRIKEAARKYSCIINAKGPVNIICSPKECIEIPGGNPGLEKGGVGDVLAGLAVALLAKNEPFLAASAASYITKAAANELYKKVGVAYSADDLADKIPETLHNLIK